MKGQNRDEDHHCLVCDQWKEQLHQIADCGHRFCAECSINYIRSQAANFSKAKCLQEGCTAELNKGKPVYRGLDAETMNRIDSYEQFLFLQGNKDAAACRQRDCRGHFLKSSKNGKCSMCSTEHCPKCLAVVHEGACQIDRAEEAIMRNLSYRKCPRCSIWVEKIAGCEYINCKCGVEFCYRCGAEYAKDPCRKGEIWRKEAEIRKLMRNLQVSLPSDLPSIFIMLLRTILFLAIVVPFTVLYCIVPSVVLVAVVEIFVFLFMPIVVFYGVSEAQDCDCRWLGYLLGVLFYPVIGAFFAVAALIIIFLYPFCRNKYHHGVYDPFDLLLSNMTKIYLQFVNFVLLCCK